MFVQQGIILGHLAAFKHHCALGFWGSEMRRVLAADGFDASDAMGTLGPLKSLADLPADAVVLGYMRTAAALVEDGARTKSLDRPRPAAAKKRASRAG